MNSLPSCLESQVLFLGKHILFNEGMECPRRAY